ncbi:transposase [Stenotrophomonas sp. SMYL11]|uniref:transposase n=1 Tax=Stenotrophomonas sp. SMYL11 TaxID=3076042 RepID=UPI002E77968C|nr:transposase [Stenotrophomonas sp. SMYL11]
MNRCRASILAGILELMPSPQLLAGRRSIVGNVYTITMVCRNHHRVFDCPANADLAMQLLGSMDREGLTASLAWIIMPDHIHWLAHLRSHSLGYCVQRFKARSSFLINRRRGSRVQSGRLVITIMQSAVMRRFTGTLAIFWQTPFEPVLPRRSVTIRMDGAAGR